MSKEAESALNVLLPLLLRASPPAAPPLPPPTHLSCAQLYAPDPTPMPYATQSPSLAERICIFRDQNMLDDVKNNKNMAPVGIPRHVTSLPLPSVSDLRSDLDKS